MQTFAPEQAPDYSGASIKETPRVITSTFGDGYKQSIPDGLNTNDATAQFTWSDINEELKDYIVQFYKQNIGKTFLWNAPGDAIGSGKWEITDISISIPSYNLYTVALSLERRFTL